MVSCMHAYETFSQLLRRTETPDRTPAIRSSRSTTVRDSVAGHDAGYGAAVRTGEFAAAERVLRPTLSPTVGPLGHERLIGVRSILNHDVMVVGGATGRHYHFAAGQSREIPLSDARLLVAEGDFGFSGGR